MECKSESSITNPSISLRINRYIMECKYSCNVRKLSCHGELIDTLWNVNGVVWSSKCLMHFRINRYIMECKLLYLIYFSLFYGELIDTLWNVNLRTWTYTSPSDVWN